MAEKIKVLYIAGWGRSGSTLLDNILGQLEGFFSVGEINCVWERNLLGSWRCGCGAPFEECEVWPGVMEEAFGGLDRIDSHKMIRLRDSGARTRHFPLVLTPWGKPFLRHRLGSYMSNLEKLYQGIHKRTGSRVIVDSSKIPSYAYLLDMIPTIDLYVVHLVRDSRAVAYSWLRKKFQPDTETFMHRHSIVESAVVWGVWNAMVEALWGRRSGRYLRLRYEDLMEDPQKALARILKLMHEDALSLPIENREVRLGVNHTSSGNPSRFKTGLVKLRPDEEWKAKMKRSHRAIVTALNWPLLQRYGY